MKNPQTSDVVVVGGGIIGCMLAYDLAREGARVELIERSDIGREASGASAGIISPPAPGLGPRVPLALAAFRRYPGLLAEVEATVGRTIPRSREGRIEVSQDCDALRECYTWQRNHGIAVEWLSLDQLAVHAPAVTQDGISAALLVRESFGLSLNDFCVAVADAAASHGATITRYTPVHEVVLNGNGDVCVRTASGDRVAGTVIVAAGSWSDSLVSSRTLSKFSVPVRGEMICLTNLRTPIQHVVSGLGGYIVPQQDGSCYVGATEDWASGFNKGVTVRGLEQLIQLASRLIPSLIDSHVDRFWAGLRPGSPDGEPVIGPYPGNERVWLVTGHFRSGALLAPATSKLVVESLSRGSIASDLQPFAPTRLVAANP